MMEDKENDQFIKQLTSKSQTEEINGEESTNERTDVNEVAENGGNIITFPVENVANHNALLLLLHEFDNLNESLTGEYSVAHLSPNPYFLRFHPASADDLLIVADKVESKQMFHSLKMWISFEKGWVYVPRLRNTERKLTEDEEEECLKQLIVNLTPIGTSRLPDECIKNCVKSRGGKLNTYTNTKRKSNALNRNIVVTWKRYMLKAVLIDFPVSCYDDATEWIESENAKTLLSDVNTLPKPPCEYLSTVKRQTKVTGRFACESLQVSVAKENGLAETREDVSDDNVREGAQGDALNDAASGTSDFSSYTILTSPLDQETPSSKAITSNASRQHLSAPDDEERTSGARLNVSGDSGIGEQFDNRSNGHHQVDDRDDDLLFDGRSREQWTRASAAERSDHSTITTLAIMMKEQRDMIKEQRDLLRLISRYIVRHDVKSPPKASSSARRSSNVTQTSDATDDSQLFRTPSRRSPFIDSPPVSPLYSPPLSPSFIDSQSSSAGSTPSPSSTHSRRQLLNTDGTDTSLQLFLKLGLPKSTRSEFEAFDEKITPSCRSFDSGMRKDLIRAIKMHNPVSQGQSRALYSLFRNFFHLSEANKHADENDANVPNTVQNDTSFFIQWIQKTETYQLIICETASWPTEYIPVVKPNNVHKGSHAILQAWNMKDHRGKVHANLQKWLKTHRVVFKRRCKKKVARNSTLPKTRNEKDSDSPFDKDNSSPSDTNNSAANNDASPSFDQQSVFQDDTELAAAFDVHEKISSSLTEDADDVHALEKTT